MVRIRYPNVCTWDEYGKCRKISLIKVADKTAYANSAGQDQTAPEGAVWSGSTLFAISLSILRNICIKSKILAKKYGINVWNFRTLLYSKMMSFWQCLAHMNYDIRKCTFGHVRPANICSLTRIFTQHNFWSCKVSSCRQWRLWSDSHYENTLIQIYWKFHHPKLKTFR